MSEFQPQYQAFETDPTTRRGNERGRLNVEHEWELRVPCLAYSDWDCVGPNKCPLFQTALDAVKAGSHIPMIVGRNLSDSGKLSPCPQYPASL